MQLFLLPITGHLPSHGVIRRKNLNPCPQASQIFREYMTKPWVRPRDKPTRQVEILPVIVSHLRSYRCYLYNVLIGTERLVGTMCTTWTWMNVSPSNVFSLQYNELTDRRLCSSYQNTLTPRISRIGLNINIYVSGIYSHCFWDFHCVLGVPHCWQSINTISFLFTKILMLVHCRWTWRSQSNTVNRLMTKVFWFMKRMHKWTPVQHKLEDAFYVYKTMLHNPFRGLQ